MFLTSYPRLFICFFIRLWKSWRWSPLIWWGESLLMSKFTFIHWVWSLETFVTVDTHAPFVLSFAWSMENYRIEKKKHMDFRRILSVRRESIFFDSKLAQPLQAFQITQAFTIKIISNKGLSCGVLIPTSSDGTLREEIFAEDIFAN